MKHLTTKELASMSSIKHSTSKGIHCKKESHDATRSLISKQHSAGQPKRRVTHRTTAAYVEKAQLPKLHESRVAKRNINAHYN